MASELILSGHLAVNDLYVSPFLGGTTTFDMAGDVSLVTQNIGTGAEALILGDVASPAGLIIVYNTDPTNYVELGLDSGVSTKVFARIYPGEFAVWSPSAAGTIYGKANTAACDVTIFACDAVTLAAYSADVQPNQSGGVNQLLRLVAVVAGGTDTITLAKSKSWPTLTSYTDWRFDMRLFELEKAHWTEITSAHALDKTVNILNTYSGEDATIALGSGGTDPVATLSKVGHFCLLPLPDTKLLYAEGDGVKIVVLESPKQSIVTP